MASAENSNPTTTVFPGALQRYFEVALYLLVSTGFATLASTGGLGAGTVVLVSAALLVRGYMLFKGADWLIPGALDLLAYCGLRGVLRGRLLSDLRRISQRNRSSGFVRDGGATVLRAARP